MFFNILKEWFNHFSSTSSVFIFGAEYHKVNAEEWQLLNFLIGEAKMAIYTTRKNKLRGKESVLSKSICWIS